MAINIIDIINTGTIKVKSLEIDDVINTITDIQISKTFLDAIRNATTHVADINCADNIINNTIHSVGDYFDNNFKIKNIVRNVGNIGDFSIVDNKITSFICHSINTYYTALLAFIEPILKLLLLLIRKIEKLRTKVQKALLDFSKQLRDCFIRIILDAEFGLGKIVRKAVDFDGLLALMKQCPCIMELIQEKFTKCKNLTTPGAVITCLQNEYLFNPNQILDQMNQWTKNNILDNINDGFNAMDEAIKSIISSILVPFRKLVKEYCRQLNKKYNVDFLLSKDPSIRCLFVYTKEFDKSGKEYFGMSVIDMLNTMKKWNICIDFVCSTLHDDIKRKIQELNEKLKLDFKYWNDEITLDIYFACIAPHDQFVRPTVIREIYSHNKGKGVLIGLIDVYKDIGKVILERDISEKVLGNNVINIQDQTNSQDSNGLDIIDGVELFKPGIEDLIIKIYFNLDSEIEKDFYYRKILELSDWDFKFKKSQKYVDVKHKLNKNFQNILNTVYTKPNIATAEVNISSRSIDSESYSPSLIPNLPTYEVPEDFNTLNIKPKPERAEGESLSSFYKRWYTLSV